MENHALEYIESGVPYLRYEDLYDRPEEELKRLFNRWGITPPEEKIKEAVAKNDLINMTSNAVNLGVAPTHFRQGGHGNYLKELPDSILKDMNQRFKNHLERWGYTAK